MSSNYNFDTIKSDNAFAEALSKGCTVRVAERNELLIDIDDEDGWHWFAVNIGKVEEHIGCTWAEIPSPSGDPKHKHIVVTLDREIDNYERIILQSVLGSDRQREALSWIRLINDDPNPTLFYQPEPKQLVALTSH